MDSYLVIPLIILLLIILLVLGLYIHSVLLATGVIGLILLDGFGSLSGLLGNEPFNRVASYTLSTIPLFVLMAQFILHSGLVQDVFYIVHKVSRGRNSLLGVLTLMIGGMLGAVSGSGTATAAALGQVATPELRRHGYSGPLAGIIAASGGSLSGIIPPSIILILYGVATETPIGKLFIGAIIPGIIVMFSFILVMLVYFAIEQKKGKTEENESIESTEEEKIPLHQLIIAVIVSILIVVIIFGGIYTGVFTPTEAGAIGSLVSLIAAILLGKFNFNFLKVSVLETIKLTGMVMLIMIGAQIFGRFVSLSLFPRKLISLLEPIMDYPVLVLVLISIILFVLFMFIEGAAVILMSIPVLLPIIQTLQVDILWFGVVVSAIATIGLITPPVGMSVFAVAGATGIRSESIFRLGIVFAVVAMVIFMAAMILFPELATWLPNRM